MKLPGNKYRVWRFQDADGFGPYAGQRFQAPEKRRHVKIPVPDGLDCDEIHPAPIDDFDYEDELEPCGFRYNFGFLEPLLDQSARFGFLTEADAWRWFGDAGVMALLDAGFDLVRVDATEVYLSRSRRQVMYR
jgi:hypothetical protein